MPKTHDKRVRIYSGKPRELYNDADSEQREGLEDPLSEPMRDELRKQRRKVKFDPSSRKPSTRSRHSRG